MGVRGNNNLRDHDGFDHKFVGSLAFHTNSTAPMLRVSRSVDIEHCRSAFSKIDAGTRPLKKKEDYTIEEWIIAYYDKVPVS